MSRTHLRRVYVVLIRYLEWISPFENFQLVQDRVASQRGNNALLKARRALSKLIQYTSNAEGGKGRGKLSVKSNAEVAGYCNNPYWLLRSAFGRQALALGLMPRNTQKPRPLPPSPRPSEWLVAHRMMPGAAALCLLTSAALKTVRNRPLFSTKRTI